MDPESFVRGGPTLMTFFFFDEGRKDPNTTLNRASLAHQLGVSMACRSWPNIKSVLGIFVIFQGSGPLLLQKPIFL